MPRFQTDAAFIFAVKNCLDGVKLEDIPTSR